MKKLIACVLTLAMLVSMLSVAVAEKIYTDGIQDGYGTVSNTPAAESSSGYDDYKFQYNLAGLAAKRGESLDNVYGVTFTIVVSGLESGFGGAFIWNTGVSGYNWVQTEWANPGNDKPIIAVATGNANGLEYTVTCLETTAPFSDSAGYNNVAISSYWGADITVTKVDALDVNGDVLFSSEDSGLAQFGVVATKQGPIEGEFLAMLEGFDFTEENYTLRLTFEANAYGDEYSYVAKFGNSSWGDVKYIYCNSEEDLVQTWTLKEIGEFYASAGADPKAGVLIQNLSQYNDSDVVITKAELICTPDTGVIYKQMAENPNGSYNIRFVQLISEEDAKKYSNVFYSVKYDGVEKDSTESNLCFKSISIAGDTLTAPEGYAFVACVVLNVPARFSYTKMTCDMEFTPVAAQ